MVGTKYQTTCNDCKHEFLLTEGGGWSWYQKICDACGRCLNVPRKAPKDFDGTMTREQIVHHLANSAKWSHRGGTFEPSETAIIEELTAHCQCGGSWIPEWKKPVRRCPACKSTSITPVDLGIAFD
jgi:predicted Zn-ribbon and HTH transcriptional regulator